VHGLLNALISVVYTSDVKFSAHLSLSMASVVPLLSVILIAVLSTLLSEGFHFIVLFWALIGCAAVNYVLIYRTEGYKRLKSLIERTEKKSTISSQFRFSFFPRGNSWSRCYWCYEEICEEI